MAPPPPAPADPPASHDPDPALPEPDGSDRSGGSEEPDATVGGRDAGEADGDGADGDDGAAEGVPATTGGAGRPGVLASVAGALSLVYVVWYILDLVTLSLDPAMFNAFHDAADNVGMRLLFAVLFLAIAYHGLDGLRRTLLDVRPAWTARDPGLRAAVAFLTTAVAVPMALVILWPSVRTWGS